MGGGSEGVGGEGRGSVPLLAFPILAKREEATFFKRRGEEPLHFFEIWFRQLLVRWFHFGIGVFFNARAFLES